MNTFDLKQYLMDNGIDADPSILIAAGLLLGLVMVYLIIKLRSPKKPAPRRGTDSPRIDIPASPKPKPAPEVPTLRVATATTPAAEPRHPAPATARPATPTAPVIAAKVQAPRPAWIPEDSVLRRHFMHHLALMAHSVAGPRPTDSVLIRHHRHLAQGLIDACQRDEARLRQLRADYAARLAARAVAAPAAPASEPTTIAQVEAVPAPAMEATPAAPRAPRPAWVPEDSVLRRHFMHHLALMAHTVAGPRPTDSVLVRHHQQLAQSLVDACLRDEARLHQLRTDYAARPAVLALTLAASSSPASEPAPAAPTVAEPIATHVGPQPAPIPQDSVLRRHFMHHVLHMLRSVAPPRPTDSVLARHYEQFLNSELNACLRDRARLERLISSYGGSRTARAA